MSLIDITPKTVIEACITADGTAELATVYDVAAAVGLADQPVRLAIRRMEAGGILHQEGRGRKGRLVLTDSALAKEHADARYLDLVSAQDAGAPTWGGTWWLFTFSVPERFRAERDLLRTALVRVGAAPLAHGVYVSPYNLRGEVVRGVAADTVSRYLISAEVASFDGPGLGDPLTIAETLWPAAEIEAAYGGLVSELARADPLPEGANEPTSLACALRLAGAFTFALERDPLIPPELRGPDWSPPAVRRDFRVVWERLRRDLPDVRLFSAYDAPR